jgi:outer membrane lipoprotein SlyB
VLGLPACLVPIVGIVFGILAIVFGTLSIHSKRKIFAIIGISLAVLVLLASLFLWVMNAQELASEHSSGKTLSTANSGKLQVISTPCYTTKIPAEMHVTHTAGSCTFLGATSGSSEQEEVKVIQVPGLSQATLATAAKADAANVVGAIPGGSIGNQGSATFAGSHAYQIEIKSTDGSAGLISYVYDTTAQGNLVIVLHTQAHASTSNYDLSLIESNWAWL